MPSLFGMELPKSFGGSVVQEGTDPSDAFGLFQKGRREQTAQAAAQAAQTAQAPAQGSAGGYATLSGSADPKVAQHRTFIEAAAKKYNVPANVIAGVMMVESGGNGKAVGANTKWGNAKGAMQVMPFWFKAGENPFDLATNIDRGVSILANNYKRRGNWDAAIQDYNGTYGKQAGTSYLNKVMGYVNKWGGASAPAGSQAGSQSVSGTKLDGILKDAMGQQGKPYVLGAKVDLKSTNPGSFDCSSLVQWAFGRQGVTLPRLARQQYSATARVDKNQLQPGDLVFFQNTTSAGGITHVGLYIGNGQMVNAVSEGKGVQVQSINSPYWSSHYAGAGRVGGVGTASPVGSGSSGAAAPAPWSFGSIFRRS